MYFLIIQSRILDYIFLFLDPRELFSSMLVTVNLFPSDCLEQAGSLIFNVINNCYTKYSRHIYVINVLVYVIDILVYVPVQPQIHNIGVDNILHFKYIYFVRCLLKYHMPLEYKVQ